MNKDSDKMYELIEAMNMDGPQKNLTGEKPKSKKRDKQRRSLSHKRSRKCNYQCVDCFLTFCLK